MNDPFLTRDWAESHERLTTPLHAAFVRLGNTLRVSLDWLYHYEFDAPWQERPVARRKAPARRGGLA